MRFIGTKNIIPFLISALMLLHQMPGFTQESAQTPNDAKFIQSTQDIKDNFIKDTVKYNNKSLQASDLEKLKAQLSKKDTGTIDNALNLSSSFTAFPQKAKTNLFLRDIDVPSVLRVLAKEGGKNIVLDDTVRGVINADLRNVSLNEAMEAILTSQELEYRLEGSTIFVASRPAMAKKGLNRKFIKAFKLNNASADEVAKILEASIFNKGYAVKDEAGSAMQAVAGPEASGSPAAPAAPAVNQQNPAATGTSTGQSSLIATKTIRGKVMDLDPGSGFSDANRLASQIKIQNNIPAIKDIEVSNNDGNAIVIPDTRTNSILVAGLQQDILLAEQAVSYLDKPLPQVAIEVSLVELNKTNSSDLGLTISGKGGKFSSGYNSPGGILSTLPDQTGIMFSTIKGLHDNITARVNALVSSEKGKLLANPTVMAVSGTESLIKITDQIVSKMTITSQATTGTITYSPEISDVGVVLNILPKVSNDGYITMRVRPSVTSFLREVSFGENGYANLIATREVIMQETRVKSGETLAIAGLIKEKDLENISKIPFAGDMPIFGQLFRNKTYDHEKSELVILITPRIIDDVAYN